jgi:hypothetical protein
VNRRSWIATAALSLGASLLQKEGFAEAKPSAKSENDMIVLYCDLAVTPAKEKEMLDVFGCVKMWRPRDRGHHNFQPSWG